MATVWSAREGRCLVALQEDTIRSSLLSLFAEPGLARKTTYMCMCIAVIASLPGELAICQHV